MTDKQIIINGIDVSKCEYYGKYSTYYRIDEELCSGNPDCHCKQLARAREENEKWKHQAELGSDTTDRLTKDIERLSEENEKLKSQIENEKQALQIDIDNLNQACLDLNQENDDLRNKLQAKEQLSVKQSHELIRLRKELQENKQKNVILLQENEELKNATVTLAEGLNFRQERADKLEQECEGLEFDYQKQLKNTNKWIVECENLQKQLESYKQTLDEIEKTANKNFTHTSWKEYEEQLMQILDIINKAKEK